MGILLQAVQSKINELNIINNAPAPAFKEDPKKNMADLKKRIDTDHIKDALGTILLESLRKLPKEKQDEFYEKNIQQNRRARFTKQMYDERLDPNTHEGKTKLTWLLNDATFGQNWEKTIESLEEMIGPEEAEKTSLKIPEIKAPSDPSIKREEKLDYPHADEIEALKKTLPADDAENRKLLDEIKEDLAVASQKTLDYLDKVDGDRGKIPGMQSNMNGIHFDDQNDFIDTVENGKYKQKLPHIPSTTARSGYFYSTNLDSPADLKLSPQDIEAMRKMKPGVPEDLKNDLISITDRMDKIGVEKYQIKGKTVSNAPGSKPGEQRFLSEQGTKYYAYWPLAFAREDIIKALAEKDMNKLRQAHEAYQNTKREMDEMLKTVQKHPTGVFSGNINSTRPNGDENPVPLEHLEDFAGHSQVNGAFCLYALSKNTKSSVKELLEDPAKVLSKDVKRHIKDNGLHTKKTTGAKLVYGLSSTEAGSNFEGAWSNDTGMLCNRALENVASLADDPKDRSRILGTVTLATAAAAHELSLYTEKWKALQSLSKEQKEVLYQHAILLPEAEFDPIKMAEEFAKPDWKKRLDTDALIDRLQKEGKLDLSMVRDRVEEVVKEADAIESGFLNSQYKEESLRHAALGIYNLIEAKASPEEREAADMKDTLNEARINVINSDSFSSAQDELIKTCDELKVRKSGWFLSSTDSQEHQQMVMAQNLLRLKLMQIQGQELPELPEEYTERLDSLSIKEAFSSARAATLNYCMKKTNNGSSFRFLHEAGENRFDAARRTLQILDVMEDGLGLRTPTQKAIDNCQLGILDDRSEKSWTKNEAERAAAKVIYAMTINSQSQTYDSQQKRLDPNRLEQGIAYIRMQDSFKEMFRKEGADKITDYIAEGNGKLMNAYIKALKSVDEKQQGGKDLKDPNTMTMEEKSQVMKDIPLQM
ncbi:MAG: hypothetical protein K5771_07610 [Oscillospiraceae bacterium]|nr:hypothetical protein [Oscillospiraceae bacterium]